MRKTVSGIMLILISLGILAITPLVESLPIIEFEGYTDKPQYEPAETGTVYFWIYNLGPDSILLRNITILYPWYSNRTIANIDIALPKDGNYSNTDNFTIPNDSEEVHSSIQFQILYSVGSSTFSIWEFISINVIPYGTIYIRANGSVEGTDKITSTDNVTYTFTGDINGSIVVERDNILIDGAGHMEQGTFQGSGNIPGIDLSNRNNVTIKNTIIQKFYDSIHIYDSSNNMIIGNNITNNFIGILLMGWSSNNSMSGNNVTDNNNGIYLGSSSNHNSISENTFFNDGLTVWNSYGNVVVDNLVNGRPLVYLEGVSDYAVDDAGQVILVNCNNILVENLDLSHTSACVQLWGTSNTRISENNMTNGDGIWIYMSSNNSISGNDITDCGIAINIDSLSNDNSISGNNIANNGDGIWIFWSSNNNVSGNNIANNYYGVGLVSSSNNSISGNNITASNDYGIYLGSTSNNNSVSGNNIANNDGGITFWSSSNNRVYHNNLVGNAIQIDSYDSANTWDDGYPSGGNYWSDYAGTDAKSGSNQDQPGSDGIGDTPYFIDVNNTDRYPLMTPYGATPPPTYALTITATFGGTTNPSPGTYSYTANSQVQVTAIPNPDHPFDHWELDSTNVGSANPYTVLMDKDHTLKAVFELAHRPPPSASINPLSASINVGQSVTFTSTVSGGYTPYSYQWYLNGNPVSGATANTWTFTPTAGGIYYINLKVTDSKANTAQSDTARITVATVPVGGYSFPIQVHTKTEPILPYIALIAILTAIFTKLKQKTKRKR